MGNGNSRGNQITRRSSMDQTTMSELGISEGPLFRGNAPSYTFQSSVTLRNINVIGESDPEFNKTGPPINIKGGCSNSWLKGRDLPSPDRYLTSSQPNLSEYTFQYSALPTITNLDQLARLANYNPNVVRIGFSVTVTGNWKGCTLACGCGTFTWNTRVRLRNGSWSSFSQIYTDGGNSNPSAINSSGNLNGVNLGNYAGGSEIQIHPQCSGSCACCEAGMTNLYFYMNCNISVDMPLLCEIGNNFDNLICRTYCSYDDTDTNCVNIAKNYCFTKTDSSVQFSEPIFDETNSFCTNFLQTYFSKRGAGDASVDEKFKNLCVQNLIDAGNYDDVQLIEDRCACFLSDTTYQKYRDDLIQLIPSFSNQPGDPRCLFPGCAVAKFRSVEILGESNLCPAFTCIQGISLNNSGNISTTNLVINNDAKCINYVSGSDQGECSTNSDCESRGTDLLCRNKICVKLEALNCSSDLQCGEDYKCNTTSQKCEPILDTGCLIDSDCNIANLEVCNTDTNKCASKPLTCTTDAVCGTNSLCDPLSKICVKKCSSLDPTCPSNYICDTTNNRCSSKACSKTSDCVSPFICDETIGRCILGCISDSDCKTDLGETCNKETGICQPKTETTGIGLFLGIIFGVFGLIIVIFIIIYLIGKRKRSSIVPK